MRQAGAPEEIQPTRHTVRVQMPQAKGLNNEEILKEIRKTISGAAAIRVLHSGDIDVTVPDEATKDRAHGLPSTEELRIFKKDYLIEVPGVPLSLQVACGRNADNSHLAARICEASRSIAPGLQITRIRWLHSQGQDAQHQRATGEQPTKTRGSLIIGLSTQEMQRSAIRGGLVIDAQLFETRPFERNLLVTQCFKCQQWGHTQSACGRPARCGQCAGNHATRECPKERVSCANCGRRHRAWQRRECTSYQAYFQTIQSRRIALYTQAARIRTAALEALGAKTQPQSQSLPTATGGWVTGPRKRTRAASLSPEDSQRRLGRPTHLEQAARDPAQRRIEFSQRGVDATQESSTAPTTSKDVDMIRDES
jgi:hypothetical protein